MIKFIKGLFEKKDVEKIIIKNNVETDNNPKRKELTDKFFRNLELIKNFKSTYESYCNATNTWDSPAFGDSSITNRQYYITLTQVSDEEYSENQCQAIKTVQIHEGVLDEYILRVDSQYENLKKLYDELVVDENNLLGAKKV